MSGRDDRASRRALARHADEETRYQAVPLLDPSDAEERALLLERLGDPSWRVRAAAVERLGASEGGAAALPELVEALRRGASVGIRDAASATLARLGGVAVPALVEGLGAGDPDLRQAAAGVLGAIADRRAVAPLTARLADPDPNVRAAAAEALGGIGGPGAVEALRAAVDSDDEMLRLSAVEALRRQGACLPREVMQRLVAHRTLRRPAYHLLGASDDPEAVALVPRGLADPSRSVREAALAALGQQRSRRPGALAALLEDVRAAARADPGLADAWAASLASEERYVAAGALTALGVTGAPRHVGAMLRLAEDDGLRPLVDEAVEALPPGAELRAALAGALPGLGQIARLLALAALARLGSPAAFESLVREASEPDSFARAEAVAALGRLSDARGVPPLAGLLGDDDPAVAGLAAAALLRVAQSGPGGRLAAIAALRDRAGASPSAALYRTLGALGDPSDAGVLAAGLRASVTGHRSAAAAALAALARRGMPSTAALPALIAAIGDREWPVRASAARACAELACAAERGGGAAGAAAVAARREAVNAIRGALSDAEPAVRAAAVDALGACGGAEDAEAIAALVAEPAAAAPVVVSALRALAALGGPLAGATARAAGHPDPEVVKEAVLAAGRLSGPEAERIVLAAAASPRWDVRQAAARAMAERGDPALAAEASRLAAGEPDPLVARAFADAARALGGR